VKYEVAVCIMTSCIDWVHGLIRAVLKDSSDSQLAFANFTNHNKAAAAKHTLSNEEMD